MDETIFDLFIFVVQKNKKEGTLLARQGEAGDQPDGELPW